MTRQRVHELAKEWGVTSQHILAQLEKIGIPKKTAQNSLTADEAEKVKIRLGLTPPPSSQVGRERLVSERVIVQQADGLRFLIPQGMRRLPRCGPVEPG